jgi:hypothetical protein
MTLAKQLDKAYLIIANKKGLEEAAEFLKGFKSNTMLSN